MVDTRADSLSERYGRTFVVHRSRQKAVLPAVAYIREGDADCRAFFEQGKIVVGRIRQHFAR